MGFFSKVKSKIIKTNNADVVDSALKKVEEEKLEKYQNGLKTTRGIFTRKIKDFLVRNREVDEDFFKNLEELFITSDMGALFSKLLIKDLKKEAKLKKTSSPEELLELIFEALFNEYINSSNDEDYKLKLDTENLNIWLVTGVNGVGKTTSIAKLAKKYKDMGERVIVAAADTFRAGAVQQLNVWAEKIGIDIIMPLKEGEDPSSVVYRSIEKALELDKTILIIDTAGRLENKVNLLNQLQKIKNVINKKTDKEPNEILLVIDAITGQSGVNQAEKFNEVTNITGVILTKMDSTSKGGIILAIRNSLGIPVKFLGFGEKLEDLEEFDPNKYIYSLINS